MRTHYILIDLMRSPELVKRIGQDYLANILNNRKKLIKQQIWVVKRNIQLEEKKKAEESKKTSKSLKNN